MLEDMIVEPMTGLIQYVVIGMGTGESWIPVPIAFLGWDPANGQFVLMVTPDTLQNAPTFPSDQFPDPSTSGWDQEFSTYWQSNDGTDSSGGTGGTIVSTATATP
jgi:hypothetical protein